MAATIVRPASAASVASSAAVKINFERRGRGFGGGAFRQQRLGRDVGENDLIDVDMSPRLGATVDDFDLGFLAFQIRHIPTRRLEGLAILAGRRAHDFAGDAEVDARLARMIAAADEKSDIAPLDGELFRRCRSLWAVAADEAC